MHQPFAPAPARTNFFSRIHTDPVHALLQQHLILIFFAFRLFLDSIFGAIVVERMDFHAWITKAVTVMT